MRECSHSALFGGETNNDDDIRQALLDLSSHSVDLTRVHKQTTNMKAHPFAGSDAAGSSLIDLLS